MKVCEPPVKTGINAGQPATGKPAGYHRHWSAGEPPCESCREGQREQQRAYWKANQERYAEQRRAYRLANREKLAERNRTWRKANPEYHVEYHRARYKANPEKDAEKNRAWRKANPDKDAEISRRRKARKRGAPTVPFTADELAARLSMFPGCWMCGAEADTVDHVKPLAKGGSHMLANLRPACGSCNSAKNDAWQGVDALTRFAKTGARR